MKQVNGFTLMELLIAVTIIAILVIIALPAYNRAIERSRISEAYTQLGLIKQAELSYYDQHDEWAKEFRRLDMQNPNDNTLYPARHFDYTLPPSLVIAIASRNDRDNFLDLHYTIFMNSNMYITVNGF